MAKMNWDDPRALVELLQKIGRQEFDKQYSAHLRDSVVAVENGYQIRRVQNRYGGVMFMVVGLGYGHATIEGARQIAKQAPPCVRVTVH